MNSLLAAEGRKLNSGAGGLGGGISRRVFSSCFRRASLAAAWRLAGESFTLTTEMPPLPEEEPFKLDGEAFENEHRQERNKTGVNIQSRSQCLSVVWTIQKSGDELQVVSWSKNTDQTVGALFKASVTIKTCRYEINLTKNIHTAVGWFVFWWTV